MSAGEPNGNDLLSEVENQWPKLGQYLRRYIVPAIQSRGRPGQVLATPTDTPGPVQLQNITDIAPPNGVQQITAGANITVTPSSGKGVVEVSSTSGGTVTSVDMTVPPWQSVSGVPVTNVGTIVVTDNNQPANEVFAGPATGSPAPPAFRALVPSDIPGLVTSSTSAPLLLDPDSPEEPMMIPGPPGSTGVAGIAGAPGPVLLLEPESPEFPMMIPGAPGAAGTTGATGPIGPSGVPIFLAPDSPDEPMMVPGPVGPSGGGGGVTSVGLTMPSDFIVSGSPVTSSGTLAVTRGGVYTGNSAAAGTNSAATITATFGSNVTQGNAILVQITTFPANAGALSDAQGDSFLSIYSNTDSAVPSYFLAVNVAGGATAISCTTTGQVYLRAWELQNVVGVSAFDVANNHADSGATPHSLTASATTANASDYLLAICLIGGGGPYTTNWSAGFTQRFAQVDAFPTWSILADANVTAAGSQSVTFTASAGGGLTNAYNLNLIALKVGTGVQDFNGQVQHIQLKVTTTGSSGPASLANSGPVFTLNIPNYTSSTSYQASPLPNPAALASWTWVNQGPATASNNGGALAITIPDTAGTLNWRMLKQAVAATPYSYAFYWKSIQFLTNSQDTGIYLTDGTKFLGFELLSQASTKTLRVERITNVNTDNSTQKSISILPTGTGSLQLPDPMTGGLFGRFRNDGTTIYIDFSPDGSNWTNWYTEAVGAWLTPTGVCFGGVSITGTSSLYVVNSLQGFLYTNSAAL